MTLKHKLEVYGAAGGAVLVWALFGAPLPFNLPAQLAAAIKALQQFFTLTIGLPDFTQITLRKMGSSPTWNIISFSQPSGDSSADGGDGSGNPPPQSGTGEVTGGTPQNTAPFNGSTPGTSNTGVDPSTGAIVGNTYYPNEVVNVQGNPNP